MSDLIPPDEIYVPFQKAIDLDVLALEGVITNEHKYLLATAEREATPALYTALVWALAYLKQGVDYHDSDWYITVQTAEAAIALADGETFRMRFKIEETQPPTSLVDGEKDGG